MTAADLERIREIADRVAVTTGLEVVQVEFHGGAGKQRLLRIFIEKSEEARTALRESLEKDPKTESIDRLAGITHEDCAHFSRELSTILDVEDAVAGGSYTLEVSSPGLDRKLLKPADFQRFTGSLMKVMTREPVNGNRHWQGRLIEFSRDRLKLDIAAGGKTKPKKKLQHGAIEIEFGNVEKAKLVPEI